jgi:hypothetical protein
MNLCIIHPDISVEFVKASIVGLAGFGEELFYLSKDFVAGRGNVVVHQLPSE